jgi:hypothetical protein
LGLEDLAGVDLEAAVITEEVLVDYLVEVALEVVTLEDASEDEDEAEVATVLDVYLLQELLLAERPSLELCLVQLFQMENKLLCTTQWYIMMKE